MGMKQRIERLVARRPLLRRAIAVQSRFTEIHGIALASSITLYAFLALFPLLLLGIWGLGLVSGDSNAFVHDVVHSIGFRGDTETQVVRTVNRARHNDVLAGIGFVTALWTVSNLTQGLQNAWNSAWQVRTRGLRDRVLGLSWALGAGLLILLSGSITAWIRELGAAVQILGAVVALLVTIGLWLWTSWWLPNRHVPLRALLPAAIVGGTAFEILQVAGTYLLPAGASSTGHVYGSIGLAFAIVFWLLIVGRIVVYVACIEVTTWEAGHGTVDATLPIPVLPGDDQARRTDRVGGRKDATPR
jgi:membrane protein